MTTALSHRKRQNFANSKNQCLGKRDKSSAGRLDPRAVDVCGVINDRDEYYTTSSCAGRCYLYHGQGVKATQTFRRFRVSHDKIHDSQRYFDLTTLDSDPSGGADPIRSIGQFEHAERVREIINQQQDYENGTTNNEEVVSLKESSSKLNGNTRQSSSNKKCDNPDEPPVIWLRFEPFILHVACRSLAAASALMDAARPSFKNVGLTTWNSSDSHNFAKYLVAIWGDESLEMPLCAPTGSPVFQEQHEWLADLVNNRHERNWDKIDRFVQAVRAMPVSHGDEEAEQEVRLDRSTNGATTKSNGIPKHFDVIGDVAVLNQVPEGDEQERNRIGEAIMKKNKAIKIVVARQASLAGTERAAGKNGFLQIAGAIRRSPLMTSHAEYGIKCVIDLNRTFFSPRMGPERLRLCQQVARGEHVLVLFAGVGMEALQIAGRTEASSVVAVEMNPVAIQCLRRSHQLLERNPAVKCVGAVERLKILEGDVMQVIPEQLPTNYYDRVLAPRPKEGSMDGDLGKGENGKQFLEALLAVLKHDGGECHWYDFAADHEMPLCTRTRRFLAETCEKFGLKMEVLHVSNAGSVAMRQFRVCIDFRVTPK